MQDLLDGFLAETLRGGSPPWGKLALATSGHEAVVSAIGLHGVALLLLDHQKALSAWPADVREAIREEACQQVLWEAVHQRMLRDLLAALSRAGVQSLVMKGTALAYSVYDDPAQRRRGDTDLLVRESDLDVTRNVMLAQGLARRVDPYGLHFQESWLHTTPFGTIHAIDLHWRTSDSPVIERVIATETFFADPRSLPRLSPHAWGPRPVLTLLQVALNHAWHASHGYFQDSERPSAAGRLIWASDIDRLARHLTEQEWHELERHAIDRQVAPVVRDALHLAHEAFATVLPDGLIARLASMPAKTPVVDYLNEHDMMRRNMADLRALRHLGERVRFMVPLAFPAVGYLRQRFPQLAGWPAPAIYLWWMARALVRLGARRPA